MRRIIKKQIPFELQKELEKPAPSTGKDADNRWGRFRKNAQKEVTKSFLLKEQWWLCAYTELALDSFSHGCHIEHIEPRKLNPARTFDYHNLIVSALDSESLSNLSTHDRFGGHAKLDGYDPNLFISPLMPDSDRYFEYLSNGRVEPAHTLSPEDRIRAAYTIDLLNLNASFLVHSRREWLMEIEEEIDWLIDDESALRLLAECELCDTEGKLRPFHTAAKARFGRLGNQVMTDACIQCV